MIDISSWLKDGIISGWRRKEITFARVTELVAAYLSRGLLCEEHAAEIAAVCEPQEEQ